MNREDAARVMAVFAAAHPQVKIAEQTVSVWYEASLEKCEFDLGMELALDLVSRPDLSGKFPTPAQFNELKRMAAQREVLNAPLDKDDPEPRLPTTEAQRNFDEMRRKLGYPVREESTP